MNQALYQMGELAEKLAIPIHRTRRLVNKHGIHPVYSRSQTRLYDRRALARLKELTTKQETRK